MARHAEKKINYTDFQENFAINITNLCVKLANVRKICYNSFNGTFTSLMQTAVSKGYRAVFKVKLVECIIFFGVKMELVQSQIRKFLIISLIATFCLPVGVVSIVMGATQSIVALLVFGIVATVFGFYGTPLLWIKYSSLVGMKKLVISVEKDNLYTVRELSSVLNLREDETRNRLRDALSKRYLTGYIFENDRLVVNLNVKQAKTKFSIKCTECGAPVTIDPDSVINKCEYCGKVYSNVKRPDDM